MLDKRVEMDVGQAASIVTTLGNVRSFLTATEYVS
jgi:hypothetical protein